MAVEVQPVLRGLRTIHEFVMRAATLSVREPKGPRVVLIVLESRVSSDTLSRAWLDAMRALRPTIARRLGLVVLRPELSVFPEEPELRDLAAELVGAAHDGTVWGKDCALVGVGKPSGRSAWRKAIQAIAHGRGSDWPRADWYA